MGGSDSLTWGHLFSLRDIVLSKLEDARVQKTIGSSLEAKVTIRAGRLWFGTLDSLRDQLRYVFIVSQVDLQESVSEDEDYFLAAVSKANGQKCERCWNYSVRVGESARYPTVCERCIEALKEIEASPNSA